MKLRLTKAELLSVCSKAVGFNVDEIVILKGPALPKINLFSYIHRIH